MRLIDIAAKLIKWFGWIIIALFVWPFWIVDKSNNVLGLAGDIGAIALTCLWLLLIGAVIATVVQ